MPAIRTDDLTKSFRVRQPAPAEGWSLGRLLRSAPVTDLVAVRDLSLSIEAGERVAFIGPNGAGKSTSLKMLTGILLPSSGHAEVAGFVPWRDRRQLARHIGIVFGQRSQLWWQLPVRASFELLGRFRRAVPPAHRVSGRLRRHGAGRSRTRRRSREGRGLRGCRRGVCRSRLAGL